MPNTQTSLASVLQHMESLGGQLQKLEADKQQKLQEDLQRKQLLEALDDPQTRSALRSQLELARNQIDALALQLGSDLKTVTESRARVQKAIEKLDKSPSLSGVLASRLSEATAQASPSFRKAGISASIPSATENLSSSRASTTAKKAPGRAKPKR